MVARNKLLIAPPRTFIAKYDLSYSGHVTKQRFVTVANKGLALDLGARFRLGGNNSRIKDMRACDEISNQGKRLGISLRESMR